jgi:hypothetical protein
VWMLYSTAYYLGYLPADLEATFESAIQNPSEIPGLVSNLAYGLLSPDYGLLGDLLYYATAPLTTLPGPIGDLATAIVQGISVGINDLLSLLPDPISPTPFPAAIQGTQLVESFEVNSVPDASLRVAGGVTLSNTDPLEEKLEATDLTVQTLEDKGTLTPPVTPADTLQEPASDIDPDATPVADPDDPVTNALKSGNKVSPGDKFNQAKGETVKDETVKDNETAVLNPAVDDDPVGDPTGPTGPQDGEPAGEGTPAAADAGATA